MTASTGKGAQRKVLIIVENLPVPFDRRVWSEATTLQQAGYGVSVICPKGKDADKAYEYLDGIHVYRHPLPFEARGIWAYPAEYVTSLMFEFWLSLRVLRARGFDVIHACNPPDTVFLIGLFYKLLFRKKFIFDHHDLNPELYEAKFGRRDFFYSLVKRLEAWTFRTADISIATNNSYRQIAIERGKMDPENVHVVRSGPNLTRMKQVPPDPKWKNGREFLLGYVGVIGQQEGIDLLLEAMDYIVHTRGKENIQLVIVGGGPEVPTLEALSCELSLTDFVTFTGRVSEEDFLITLNTADVCVNPDRVNEMNDKSTMNKIMEYMVLAKPVVQFDVTEGRFSAQEASLYAAKNDPVDFAEKILMLLGDEEKRKTMGAYGRDRVINMLSWDHEGPKLLAAYDQLYARERKIR